MVNEDVVFKAILAMDAYNRGYDTKINPDSGGLGGKYSKIGSLEVIEESETALDSSERDASFYAVAYKDTKNTTDIKNDEIS